MCSGCSTCGKRTRFGNGNSRATPEKFSGCKKSSSDAAINTTPGSGRMSAAHARRHNCTSCGLGRRRRIEVNLRNRFGHDLNLWKRFLAGHDLGKALLEFGQEFFQVEPQVFRAVRLQVAPG